MLRHLARAIAPSVPAVGLVLALKLAIPTDSLALALGELALYVVVTVVATLFLERELLREMRGYLTARAVDTEPAVVVPAGASGQAGA